MSVPGHMWRHARVRRYEKRHDGFCVKCEWVVSRFRGSTRSHTNSGRIETSSRLQELPQQHARRYWSSADTWIGQWCPVPGLWRSWSSLLQWWLLLRCQPELHSWQVQGHCSRGRASVRAKGSAGTAMLWGDLHRARTSSAPLEHASTRRQQLSWINREGHRLARRTGPALEQTSCATSLTTLCSFARMVSAWKRQRQAFSTNQCALRSPLITTCCPKARSPTWKSLQSSLPMRPE